MQSSKVVLEDPRHSARWLALAVSALAIAGILSLVLVIGRLPGISDWIGDPVFAKRCLAVHVDLAMVVWMYGMVASLLLAVPTSKPRPGWSVAMTILGTVGVGIFVMSLGVPGLKPILSNYIPVLEHPMFLLGLGLFALAVCGVVLQPRLIPEKSFSYRGYIDISPAAALGIRAAAVAFVLAVLTVAGAFLTTSTAMPSETYYELLFWGGGHILQMASVACMVAIWLILLNRVVGKPIVGRRWGGILFALLILPAFVGPVWALQGTTDSPYYVRFTGLMQWCIFPVTTVFLVICLRALYKAWRSGEWSDDPRRKACLLGFYASAGLTVTGFVLGAFIRTSSTLIPAHYHASIGAVTTSYMTVTYLLLRGMQRDMPGRRSRFISAWQPVLFGFGQFIFALGFGFAGLYGLGRKAYGHEQHVRSIEEVIGLVGMGVGGGLAVIAGLTFLGLVGYAWFRNSSMQETLQLKGGYDGRGKQPCGKREGTPHPETLG